MSKEEKSNRKQEEYSYVIYKSDLMKFNPISPSNVLLEYIQNKYPSAPLDGVFAARLKKGYESIIVSNSFDDSVVVKFCKVENTVIEKGVA